MSRATAVFHKGARGVCWERASHLVLLTPNSGLDSIKREYDRGSTVHVKQSKPPTSCRCRLLAAAKATHYSTVAACDTAPLQAFFHIQIVYHPAARSNCTQQTMQAPDAAVRTHSHKLSLNCNHNTPLLHCMATTHTTTPIPTLTTYATSLPDSASWSLWSPPFPSSLCTYPSTHAPPRSPYRSPPASPYSHQTHHRSCGYHRLHVV